MKEKLHQALQYFSAPAIQNIPPQVALSRDVFQGRLDHFFRESLAFLQNETDASLLSAIAGEIGNNSFDHNMGQWKDVSGCYFDYGFEKSAWVICSDRGQGIFSSLKRVLPQIQTEQEALNIGFSQKISGRSPEKRGNGLKFVRSVVNGNKDRLLAFASGNAKINFGGLSFPEVDMNKWPNGFGTFALIIWNKKHEN